MLQMAKFCSFLWLSSSTPLFLFYSSVDGHLECFHILAVVNNAAVNIGMHVSFELGFIFVCFVYIYLGVELLDHTSLYIYNLFWKMWCFHI